MQAHAKNHTHGNMTWQLPPGHWPIPHRLPCGMMRCRVSSPHQRTQPRRPNARRTQSSNTSHNVLPLQFRVRATTSTAPPQFCLRATPSTVPPQLRARATQNTVPPHIPTARAPSGQVADPFEALDLARDSRAIAYALGTQILTATDVNPLHCELLPPPRRDQRLTPTTLRSAPITAKLQQRHALISAEHQLNSAQPSAHAYASNVPP